MKKAFFKRIAVIVSVTLLLMLTLSSCFGGGCGGSGDTTLSFNGDYLSKTVEDQPYAGNITDADEIKLLAQLIADGTSADFNVVDALKATLIGHDPVAGNCKKLENHGESCDATLDYNVAYVVAVFEKAYDAAIAAGKTYGETTKVNVSAITEKAGKVDVQTLINHYTNPDELAKLVTDKGYQGGIKNGNDMNLLANILALANSADFDSHERLVAAFRGHKIDKDGNCTLEGHDNCEGKAEFKIQYVKDVILEAYAEAKGTDALKDTDKNKVDLILLNMTELDAETLVNSFKISIEEEPYGFFSLATIGKILNWLTKYPGLKNYILGICLFAILIEILMLPFAIKQQKNSIKQASLRPKEMAIRNKYKGRTDQPTMQKMQAEIQELYQRENFSPFNGCLPLLIQLPIIMMLYSVVTNPLQYMLGQSEAVANALTTFATTSKAAGGLGIPLSGKGNNTIELLSSIKNIGETAFDKLKDFQFYTFSDGALHSVEDAILNNLPSFKLGPVDLGGIPSNIDLGDWNWWVILLVPILTFGTYFLTTKLNRKFMYQSVANEGVDPRQAACSNWMMDISMPAMSAFFTLGVPAVIGFYWMFRAWLSFGKTVIMAKVMPLPTFTEEDYKAAAKELAGKKTVKKSDKAGAVRSLHYIDDEDFEDTKARGEARRAAIEERERREKEEKANATASMPFSFGALKKDKKNKAKTEKKTEETSPAEDNKTDSEKSENENDKDEV